MNGPPAGPRYRDEFTNQYDEFIYEDEVVPNANGPDRHPHVREEMAYGNESYEVVVDEMLSQMRGRDSQVVVSMMHRLYERLRILLSDHDIPMYRHAKTYVSLQIRELFPEDSPDYMNVMRAYQMAFKGLTETEADSYYRAMLNMHKRLLNLERRLLPPNPK
jgi:aromatic ring hydroxylase